MEPSFAGYFSFFLSVYGLANAIAVLKQGVIARGLSWVIRLSLFRTMVKCPACVSFWIGAAFSGLIFSPSLSIVGILWKSVLLDALGASAVSYLLHVTAERIKPDHV